MNRFMRSGALRAAAATVAVCVLGMTGCGGYRYVFKTGLPPSDHVVNETTHQGLFGWINGAPVDLDEACPEGVAEFGSRIGFIDWLPSFLTLGLYTPRTVHIVCAQEGAHA